MKCVGAPEPLTELDYILSLRDRQPAGCCGPLITLPVIGYRVELLETSFQSPAASALLWDGMLPNHDGDPLQFRLCAAHWMDLCYLCGMQGRRTNRRDWIGEATVLIKQVSTGAGWDAREIANMMMWQRVLLT